MGNETSSKMKDGMKNRVSQKFKKKDISKRAAPVKVDVEVDTSDSNSLVSQVADVEKVCVVFCSSNCV